MGLEKVCITVLSKINDQIPLGECFEVFNMPDREDLEDRIRNNLIYYRTNYLALYALFLLITAQELIYPLKCRVSSLKFAVIDACIAIMWM